MNAEPLQEKNVTIEEDATPVLAADVAPTVDDPTGAAPTADSAPTAAAPLGAVLGADNRPEGSPAGVALPDAPLLTVAGVEYTYKTKFQTVYALRGVDCAFAAGQLTAIVGASGSGKTTLLSLLAGLDVPTAGSICFDGQPTDKMDRDAWRLAHVSVIYQNFNLFGHLTVLENTAYPLYLQKRPKQQADKTATEKLSAVGLTPDQYKRFPRMLSGGEQQRVAIARALTAGSELILADEPTGNLDEENGQNVFDILLRSAHAEGCCVVVVTHDMALAQQADCVLRIRDGKIATLAENG